MTFQKEKEEFLSKKDKSKKGSIDKKIKKLVNKINSLEDFYTTSSCSGRVLLLAIPQSNKKNKVQYLFCSHKKIKHNNIKKTLKTIITKIKLKNTKKSVKQISGELGNQRFPVSRKSERFSRMPEIRRISKQIKNNVWFKIDPVILHVACENINIAKKFLNTARDIGYYETIFSRIFTT